ncbi:MAG: pyridoxamine 5'-phosphate oxidase [Ignavibacteriales bacterium]|nr:pyridoxamine 5'-phosphate oxidase [Ignavibacteriales bacterium]
MNQATETGGLRKHHLHADPTEQLRQWLENARARGITDPSAMVLATCSPEGRPSARVVLLKSLDESGIVFYTNYESRKAKDLERNPTAALLFFWQSLGRQVRIEGTVTRTNPEETAEYFRTRPLLSQISAWVSRQSEVVSDRETLEREFERAQKRFEGKEVPPPAYWGGYRLRPSMFEFWQGRENRLHDRLRYRREGDHWIIDRLSP